MSVIEDTYSNGRWLHAVNETQAKGVYVQHRTLSSARWCNLKKRSNQIKFLGFDDFVEWSRGQYGYNFREVNGRLWSLDKDLLNVSGEKVYSKETCLFIPNSVNVFLTLRGNDRGSLPLGVSPYKTDNRFIAYCSDLSSQKYLGSYISEAAAHKAWQISKLRYGKILLSKFPEHVKMCSALNLWLDALENDILNNRETIKLGD